VVVTSILGRLVLGWVIVFGVDTSHSGQLSLLPSVRREMSTAPKCGHALRLGSKGRMAHSIRVGAWHCQVNLCDSSLTRAILSALEVSSNENVLF